MLAIKSERNAGTPSCVCFCMKGGSLPPVLANPSVHPAELILFFVPVALLLFIEAVIVSAFVEPLGFRVGRLGSAVFMLNLLSWPSFLFVLISLPNHLHPWTTLFALEAAVVVLEGLAVFGLARLTWLRCSPARRLGMVRALAASAAANVVSFLPSVFFGAP